MDLGNRDSAAGFAGAVREVEIGLQSLRKVAVEKVNSPNELKNHDLGYSRTGCGTKIHLVCDANGNYMNVVLSVGQEYETQYFEAVVASIIGSTQPYVLLNL